MMATGIGSMILIPAYGFIYDATGSFTPALIMIFCFIVVCLISMIMASRPARRFRPCGCRRRKAQVFDRARV